MLIGGWKGLGHEKKALSLERKHGCFSSLMCRCTTTPLDEVLECPGTVIASWDQSITQNWSPLLDKWWKTAKDKACWEEEASAG
jgi:hypothetical protein